MEKRVLHWQNSLYLTALLPVFLIPGNIIFKIKDIAYFKLQAEFFKSFDVCFYFLTVFIAIIIFIYKFRNPELEYKNRILKFYGEKDGEKERRSINVLEIKSVILTNRLTGETKEVNDFPYLVIRTRDGNSYEYLPIKSRNI